MSSIKPSDLWNTNKSCQKEEEFHHLPFEGRAVTDSVHERFRLNLVYCSDCDEEFNGDSVSISKHFDNDHQSDLICPYCPGKVYYYYNNKNNDIKSKKIFYHKCKDWIKKWQPISTIMKSNEYS